MTKTYEEIKEIRERKKLERRDLTKERIVEVRSLHKENLNTVYTALSGINRRLYNLQDLIKKSQYQQHGSITLSLTACGRKCAGCPHPQWYKWINSAKVRRYIPAAGASGSSKTSPKEAKFYAVRVKNPKQIIAQSRAVKDHTAALYVAEAVDLLDRRSGILKHLRYAVAASNRALENL